MKMKTTRVPLIALAILVIGIVASMLMGFWQTESSKTPKKFENNAQFGGQYRADDIRGSYTFKEISDLYNIPLESLAQGFGVEQNKAADFKCKDLETIYKDSKVEVGTGSVKMFVAFYLGQPYDIEEDTYVPKKAAQVIEEKGNPTQQQKDYLKTHIAEENQGSAKPKAKQEFTSLEIKGSSYLKDVAKEQKIPLEDLAKAFKLSKIESQNLQVKDIKTKFPEDSKVNTGSLKVFIACYNGLNYDLDSTDSFITKDGVEVIKNSGKPTQDQLTYLEKHTAN